MAAPPLTLTCCVTLGKFLLFSEPVEWFRSCPAALNSAGLYIELVSGRPKHFLMCVQVCDWEQDTHNWKDESWRWPRRDPISAVAVPASIWMLNVGTDDTIRENIKTCTYKRNMWWWFIELSSPRAVHLWEESLNTKWKSMSSPPADGMKECPIMGKYAFLQLLCLSQILTCPLRLYFKNASKSK